MEDFRRLVIVGEHDGVALSFQAQDGVDILSKDWRFERGNDVLDALIERSRARENFGRANHVVLLASVWRNVPAGLKRRTKCSLLSIGVCIFKLAPTSGCIIIMAWAGRRVEKKNVGNMENKTQSKNK